ncbi:hypothetical protein GCM10008164_35730 [Achromobacter xylosoxidans]|nr:hypothetical protein GCM10008164_35730 [Achromobacter xylosoxidans]
MFIYMSEEDRSLIDRIIRSYEYSKAPAVRRELSEQGIDIPLWTLYRRMVQLRDADAEAPNESGTVVHIIDRRMGTMKVIEVAVAASRVETAVLRLDRHAKAGR